MTIVKKTKTVPFSPQQMFALVDDVSNYASFLPWCAQSTEHQRDEHTVKASLMIAVGALRKSFTTLNRLQQGKMIEIRLINGPFKHLEGYWRFEAAGDNHCRISLDLEFEFAGGLLSFALSPIFHQISTSMLDAFCQQANIRYAPQ